LLKRVLKAFVWSVSTYGCEICTYKNDLQRKIEAFELARYCKIIRVSWTQKKSYKWVLEHIGNELELLPGLKKPQVVILW